MKRPCHLAFLVLLLQILLSARSLQAETSLKANPDHCASGLSWTTRGVPSIKVGDVICFPRVLIGGMLEARNERRFNQAVLPNHNWRGVCRVEAFLAEIPRSAVSFRACLSHESAHPTMGIREHTAKAYELIYDDVYRRMILNALSLSCCFTDSGARGSLSVRGDGHFFFLSKNTPELPGQKLGVSGGLSCGLEYRCRFARQMGLFVSLHDRLILQGNARERGEVYTGDDASLVKQLTSYPIINQTNTVVLKGGLAVFLNSASRVLDVYFRVLYGGIYGFVDSRDKRLSTSAGVEFSL